MYCTHKSKEGKGLEGWDTKDFSLDVGWAMLKTSEKKGIRTPVYSLVMLVSHIDEDLTVLKT